MPHGRLPQLDPFLKTLNDNDVTGAVLLNTIDAATLRDDCGVNSLGQRGAVIHCINKLRKQSVLHAAQNAPIDLQTPLQPPLQSPLPVTSTAVNPSTEAVEVVGEHVRSGEIQVQDSHGE